MQGRSWPLGAGMSNETLQSVRQGRHQCGRAISTLGWELRQQTEILATPNLLLIIVLRLSGLSWRRTRSVCFTAAAVCLHWAVDNQLYVCLLFSGYGPMSLQIQIGGHVRTPPALRTSIGSTGSSSSGHSSISHFSISPQDYLANPMFDSLNDTRRHRLYWPSNDKTISLKPLVVKRTRSLQRKLPLTKGGCRVIWRKYCDNRRLGQRFAILRNERHISLPNVLLH